MNHEEQLAQVREMIDYYEDSIAESEEALQDLYKMEAELAAIVSDNPYWTEPDERGARLLKPLLAIKAQLEAGDRHERMWAARTVGRVGTLHPYAVEGIFATLTPDVSPEIEDMYAAAGIRNMGALWGGMTRHGPVLEEVYDEAGELIEGYAIPFKSVSRDTSMEGEPAYDATMKLQQQWTNPNKLSIERSTAAREGRSADFNYRMATWQGRGEEWLAEHPWYIPE